jgi:hypothetical protein
MVQIIQLGPHDLVQLAADAGLRVNPVSGTGATGGRSS